MNRPILVIMAAGMGSRYGGLKQIDSIGSYGEAIMDYTIYDAKKVGFRKVIIIIKKETEEIFKKQLGNRITKYMDIEYAYQELNSLPEMPAEFSIPQGRVKPWGTCQAVLCAKDLIDGPFAVVNADDYYGYSSLKSIYDYLIYSHNDMEYIHKINNYNNYSDYYDISNDTCVMSGYKLKNTLSPNGSVARGVCSIDENSYLINIIEKINIKLHNSDTAFSDDNGLSWHKIDDESIVSMNLWGFNKNILKEAESYFKEFLLSLSDLSDEEKLKKECYLPQLVGKLLENKKVSVKVIPTSEKWFGVTYKEDKKLVVDAINQKSIDGQYPEPLWSSNVFILDVINAYGLNDDIESIKSYGNGHINDTYLLCTKHSHERLILQKINTNVFKHPVELMENMIKVTEYLKKVINTDRFIGRKEVLSIVKTIDDKYYYIDKMNNVWRVVKYIENTICLDDAGSIEEFHECGVMFGRFLYQLSSFNSEELYETIPDFHNTPDRLQNFKLALNRDKAGRAKDIENEINFVLNREIDCNYLVDKIDKKELPIRVTHNDTKLNNILLDRKTKKGVCIIDLDTIMPGLCAYDFGDSIRFGASTAAEDESDLSKVHFSFDMYKAFVNGYLEEAGSILTENELYSLPWGARLMTLECGIRFLTDYLEGDTYFKTSREKQNLDRARTQFKLVSEMEDCFDDMIDEVLAYNVK